MQQAQLADADVVFGTGDLSLEPKPDLPVRVMESPAPTSSTAAQVMDPHSLLKMAIEKGMSLETIDKLLGMVERYEAMREAERRRLAESAYIRAIAGLKSEVVTVLKTKRVQYDTKDKDGRKAGSVDFKHAELADVMKAIAAPANRVGLTWNYPSVEQGDGWVRVTCRLRHVDGHFEDLTLGAPEDHSGKKNDLQAIASAITYLQRYTLKAILGISEEGDDNLDGRSAQDVRAREGLDISDATPAGEAKASPLIEAGHAKARQGMQALTAWWGDLTQPEREIVMSEFGAMKAAARGIAGGQS